MHTDKDPIDPKTLAEMGYEREDVEPKSLLVPAAFLFGGTIAAGIIGALLIKWWHIVPEVVVEQRPFVRIQPPAGTPILQNNSDATADIATLRRHEAEILTTPAKTDDGYRIPIDDAIRLTTQRGLPVTATQTVTRPAVPARPATTAGNVEFGATPVPPSSSTPLPSAGLGPPPAGGKS